MSAPEDKTIERFARELILGCKGDPDQIVQPGTPQVYGTPSGDVFAVTPGAGVPMWRLYQTMARKMLELARQIDSERAEKPDMGKLLADVQACAVTNEPKESAA